jgi:hypothetical protein
MDNSDSDLFYQSPQWKKAKERAYKRYGRRCMATGLTEKDGIVLSVDKIKPRSKWPHLALKLSNHQILWLELNRIKSDKYIFDARPLFWRWYYKAQALLKWTILALAAFALALILSGVIDLSEMSVLLSQPQALVDNLQHSAHQGFGQLKQSLCLSDWILDHAELAEYLGQLCKADTLYQSE